MSKKLHPELQKVQSIWAQVQILKEEDRGSYKDFMIPLPNESKVARREREDPFVKGFINPTTFLLRSKADAIFKQKIRREGLSDGQQAFVEACDRSQQGLAEVMQNEVTPSIAAYGTVFAVLDKPAKAVDSKEQELAEARPYLTILDPRQVIDWAYGEDGALLWFKYWVDAPKDNSDPWNPTRPASWSADKGIACWTRTGFTIKDGTGKKEFQPEIAHEFGVVPVVIQAQYVEPNRTVGGCTFFSSSDYIVMGNALENASNMEVLKNSNSTLAMDVQDWDDEINPTNPKDPDTNLRRLQKQAHDFKNVFLYSKNKPEFITKDLDLIEKAAARADRYFDLAIENEKRQLSADPLQAPASGVSKGYDFAETNGMLASLAAAAERFEEQALRLVAIMLDEPEKPAEIAYPQDFDVRDYNARLEFVKGLKDTSYPSKTGMREAYKTLTPEITPDEKKQAEINAEIDAAEPLPEPAAPPQKLEPKPQEKE